MVALPGNKGHLWSASVQELRSIHGDVQAQASQLTGRRTQADEDPKALLCAAVPELETDKLDAEDGDIDVVRTGAQSESSTAGWRQR